MGYAIWYQIYLVHTAEIALKNLIDSGILTYTPHGQAQDLHAMLHKLHLKQCEQLESNIQKNTP